ncbi:M15 family metallopeptidase [Nocardioides sp.]|uniref:M15 family metallopeptidase n=1 Tax=Nocardioides sp. TaxID=35761 RepID=UPI002F401EB6
MGRARSRRRAVVAAACVLLALVLAACGDRSSSSSADPTSNPTGGTGPSSVPTVDPTSSGPTGDHTVARPGPFRAPLHTPDMLIFRQHPLSARIVNRIRHVQGVTRVERFSLAQVSIQDHAINVAAVNPATYRNFNPDAVAQFQPEWNRIAAGEMALRSGFRKQVAKSGYVRLGASADAPQVHVGAYSPQIPQVDAVVNDSWVETLGMRKGNALLVSTGIRTPLSIRKPIQRIVGHSASVQRLDVAARLGLDPKAVQIGFLVGSAAQAVGSYSYTVTGGGRIAPQQAWVTSHISTETMPIIGPMTCNTQMFPQLRAALEEIQADGLAPAIHPQQYGGCFVPRFIAGTTTLSNHAFGLAFDVNVPENQRGTVGRINRQVVAVFEEWGFTWGGTWRYTDPMHFELNRIVHPG